MKVKTRRRSPGHSRPRLYAVDVRNQQAKCDFCLATDNLILYSMLLYHYYESLVALTNRHQLSSSAWSWLTVDTI